MKKKSDRLIVDGNAFYEIDLECLEKKKIKQEYSEEKNRKRDRPVKK